MLSITDFKKKYPGNDEPVLYIPQLELKQGIYWIKGGNGSGKTTLLKCMAGLIPFEGSIAVNKFELSSNRMGYTKIVNYAEAEPQYPPFLSGSELVDFYISVKGGTLPGIAKALETDKFIHNKTAVYSSGMLKKLSLLLGFIGNPTLILLDEPLIALDAAAVDGLQATIKEYSNAGVSFIITSHQALDSSLVNEGNIFTVSDKRIIQQDK